MRRRMTFGTLLLALILCGADCALDEAKDVGFFDRAARKDIRQMLQDGSCTEGQHVATQAECDDAKAERGIPNIDCRTLCLPDK